MKFQLRKLKFLPVCISIILFCLSTINARANTNNTQDKLTRILIIFDCSNSMFGIWESDSKFNIAKRLVGQMVDSLSREKNVQLALRCYGHQKPYPPQDCDDSKLEVPFARDNGWQIKSRLNTLKPSGTTPIAMSLEACAKDFPDRNSRNIVLLITDGKEECGGDPCAISAALQSKGIVLRPFIVGVGKMDEEITSSFNCIGNYYDASSETSFKQVLKVIITQVLNQTTCQVSLLDETGKPSETDVAMSFYDEKTGNLKYHFIHTMNNRGFPDTLRIDHLSTYKVVVHTIPEVTKSNIVLSPGKHTIIPIDAPQGLLQIKAGNSNLHRDLQCIIREKGKSETLEVFSLKDNRKLITGIYDLEILTLPRTKVSNVKISQSYTTTVEIDEPGTVNFQFSLPGVCSILEQVNKEYKWVANLGENTTQEVLKLQPGKYKAVFRGNNIKETLFTIEKTFIVEPGTSIKVLLK